MTSIPVARLNHAVLMRYNQLLETGGAVVGDSVKITLEIEAVRQD